jgi:hypothetical protein
VAVIRGILQGGGIARGAANGEGQVDRELGGIGQGVERGRADGLADTGADHQVRLQVAACVIRLQAGKQQQRTLSLTLSIDFLGDLTWAYQGCSQVLIREQSRLRRTEAALSFGWGQAERQAMRRARQLSCGMAIPSPVCIEFVQATCRAERGAAGQDLVPCRACPRVWDQPQARAAAARAHQLDIQDAATCSGLMSACMFTARPACSK